MKFLWWYIESQNYKAKTNDSTDFIVKLCNENIAYSEEIERLKKENKKLRSEVYSLKNAIRKKKRERRKPIVQKAKQMAKELNVEIPYFGEVE